MDRETQNQSQFIYGRYIKSTSIHGLSGACTETNRVSNAPLNGRTTGSSPIPISMQCRPLRRPLAQTRIDIIPQFFLESGRWLSVLYVYLINERAPLLHSIVLLSFDQPKWMAAIYTHAHGKSSNTHSQRTKAQDSMQEQYEREGGGVVDGSIGKILKCT